MTETTMDRTMEVREVAQAMERVSRFVVAHGSMAMAFIEAVKREGQAAPKKEVA
jgi:hypothetical protein